MKMDNKKKLLLIPNIKEHKANNLIKIKIIETIYFN